ncbi:MAG: PLP-dependent aminotransferase family protein [Clostridiales Family XIII bacterium]|jgi:DNA-binding transcriptional MocR family regulator|nr:PLP-dependent aminotransferase family protein [Clostridiales Family XIII bacterium]
MRKCDQIIDYIYRSIQAGILKQGDNLPSVRMLAKQFGFSITPVGAAYARLEEQGIIEGVERVGHRLVDIEKVPPAVAYDSPPIPIPPLMLDFLYQSNAGKTMEDGFVPLGSMVPTVQYFPNDDLARCLSHSARKFEDELNTYGFAHNRLRSHYHIENETARYIFRVHGLVVPGSEICLTSGASEASLFAMRALTRPGDTVAVESPGVLSDYINLQRLHLTPLEIPTAFPDGMDLDALEGHLQKGMRPKCLLVTPNFQNPTGALMPLPARKRLLELSRKYRFVVIENDTLGALRFGERIPSLKEQCPDEVVYVGSYSKTFAPGYRSGWAAGGKHSFNIMALHMLETLEDTLAGHLGVMEYVRSGKYFAHIKNLRAIYRENMRRMRSCLHSCFPPGTQVTEPQGGAYLWVTLPDGVSAEKIYYAALDRGILLAPGNLFSQYLHHDANLRISYAMPITEQVTDALAVVGGLVGSGFKA